MAWALLSERGQSTRRPPSTWGLAGLTPAAVVGELLQRDGSVVRGRDLLAFARRNGVAVVTISELIQQRRLLESLVERVVSTPITTPQGSYVAFGYLALPDRDEHMALVRGDVSGCENVLVYIHLACWEGDVFRSATCDCRARLDAAQDAIAAAGRGVIVHLLHDGYPQHRRHADVQQMRDYGLGAQILSDLGL